MKIIRQSSQVLTYHCEEAVKIGAIVTIPVGNKKQTGVVWKDVKRPKYTTKPIETIYPTVVPAQLLKTAEWMASYYSTHLATVLQTILPSGITKKRREKSLEGSLATRTHKIFKLNTRQQSALKTLKNAGNKTVLLHGITGSGKTAVYIEYCKNIIKNNQSIIVLTPEISLTPQLTAEFSRHFENVIFTHSQLTEADRHRLWQEVLEAKKPQVIIGPRSALFMPVKKLGAIIIDECHEPTFKQEQQPRYHAARVARILATHHDATLVLGSATPSVIDYYLAEKGGIIASLNERAIKSQPPQIRIIDATKREAFSRNQLFSTFLLEAMAKQLTLKKQVLLFHNRRGTASSALCENCGWHAACGRCLLPLSLHADIAKLICHVCGDKQNVPPNCPECRHADIIFKGVGTKRLAEEIAKLFPSYSVARFDGDSLQGAALHDQYQKIYDGEINIIVGTQIVAKGLDLPHLGLVALPQADAGLMLPDYGARERTFQLISQACGRVGRQTHATEAIIQTFYAADPVITEGVRENYPDFYRNELIQRQRANYPPFIYLLKLVCAYKTEAGAVRAARGLSKQLRANFPEVTVIGPTPAFYERLRGLYRWQITVKSSSRKELQKITNSIPKNWYVELDPHSLLS